MRRTGWTGWAAGGGHSLHVVCDLTLASKEHAKFMQTDADVASADQVADVLAEHPQLLQRPVLVKDGRAIIGRPKDRVEPFLRG